MAPPMQPTPDISIIVPAYNEELRLEAAVRGYLDHWHHDGRTVELIAVAQPDPVRSF